MKRYIALLITIAVVILFNLWITGCSQGTTPDLASPERPGAVIEIPYALIQAENPGKEFKPMAMFPGVKIKLKEKIRVSVEDLPKNRDISYDELSSFAIQQPMKSVCSGSKSCEFVCGRTRYIITGVPDNCRCFGYEVCHNCIFEKWVHTEKDGDAKCELLSAMFIYYADDPKYPDELQYDEQGHPTCTKHQKWDWGTDDDRNGLNEPPPPEPYDPQQLLFPFMIDEFIKEEENVGSC